MALIRGVQSLSPIAAVPLVIPKDIGISNHIGTRVTSK